MKKYSIHLNDGNKVTVECVKPEVGGLGHDLVCKNDLGETVAYFHTFLYWMEYQDPRTGCMSVAK